MIGTIRRIGQVTVVVLGWLLSYTYAIHLVGPYADTCNQGDDSAYSFSLAASAFTVFLSGALIAPGPTWGVRSRLFLVPHLGTLALAVIILPAYLTRVTVQGQFICAASGDGGDWPTKSAAAWHRLYAPAHLLLLGSFLAWAWFRQNAAHRAANIGMNASRQANPHMSSAWIELDSEAAFDDLMSAFAGFHDACLREVSIATETYVDEQGAMSCPGHLDTSALMFFQSQGAKHRAIEISCKGVSFIRVSPTPDGHDSILAGAGFSRDREEYRLGLSFVGGPLVGPPNSSVEIVSGDPVHSPDIEVRAAMMSWRPVHDAAGPRRRYRIESYESA